jgi:hypothetical protein
MEIEVFGRIYELRLGTDRAAEGTYLELRDRNTMEVVLYAFHDEATGRTSFSAPRQNVPLELVARFVRIASERLPLRISDTLSEARALWDAGKVLESARLLLGRFAPEAVPYWAHPLLELGLSRVLRVPWEAANVLAIARDRRRWKDADDAASSVRELIIAAEGAPALPEPLTLEALHLAENVAKLAYNASGAAIPFDGDPAFALVTHLRALIDQAADADLAAEAWKRLSTVPPDLVL